MRRVFAVLAIFSWLGCGGAQENQVYALAGEAFGSTWSAKWVARPGGDSAEIRVVIDAELAGVDRRFSTWREDSELSRAMRSTTPVAVEVDTALLVEAALDLAEQSGGAFDPTVAPLIRLWGFGGGEPRKELPTEEEIATEKAKVGWQRVHIDWTDPAHPHLDLGGTTLDVDGIAPGYASDRIAHALSMRGLDNHMVEVGGEIVVHGSGPRGDGWGLGVDMPVSGMSPGEALAAVLRVSNVGVSTSGDYRTARETEGLRYGHTLDPRTGRPVTHDVVSVTTVAPDCATADGWATALMVLGEGGLPLVEAHADLDALLLVRDADGRLVHRESSGMSEILLGPE